ncbi:hypothetical protein GEMRC1_010654 [Eukaryota sp. GEM-RC1]
MRDLNQSSEDFILKQKKSKSQNSNQMGEPLPNVIATINELRVLAINTPDKSSDLILDQLLNLDITDVDPQLLLASFDEWRDPVLLQVRERYNILKLIPNMICGSLKQSRQMTTLIDKVDRLEKWVDSVHTLLEEAIDKNPDRVDEIRPYKVLILGLGGAGKTKLLYLYKGQEVETIPTIGFNVESMDYKQKKFNMWDIGGGCRLRALWRHYYQDSHVMFFVIDALDRSSLCCSSDDCKDCVYCVYLQIVQEIDHLSRKPQICFLLNVCFTQILP